MSPFFFWMCSPIYALARRTWWNIVVSLNSKCILVDIYHYPLSPQIALQMFWTHHTSKINMTTFKKNLWQGTKTLKACWSTNVPFFWNLSFQKNPNNFNEEDNTLFTLLLPPFGHYKKLWGSRGLLDFRLVCPKVQLKI